MLRGGPELEFFDGGGGDDVIEAGGGNDDVSAGRGDDRVHGGDGDDGLRGGKGADRLFGDAGDDELRARDDEPDELDCGDGAADVARIDGAGLDATVACERVREEEQAEAALEEAEVPDEDVPVTPATALAP